MDILTSYHEWLNNNKLPAGKKKTLLAALELFSKYGYNGTSTNQIAEHAGVSQATIFKYFKTKEELLYSIVEPILLPLFNEFLIKLTKFKTIEEGVTFFVENRLEFLETNEMIIKIIIQEIMINNSFRTKIQEILIKNDMLSYTGNWLSELRKNDPKLNKKLTNIEIIRIIAGNTLTYFIQCNILNVPTTNKTHDRKLIINQIITLLSK